MPFNLGALELQSLKRIGSLDDDDTLFPVTRDNLGQGMFGSFVLVFCAFHLKPRGIMYKFIRKSVGIFCMIFLCKICEIVY